MKKSLIAFGTIATTWLLMTLFVANIVEQAVKKLLAEHEQTDISIELLSYQRNLFSANIISLLTIKGGADSDFSLKISSTVHHYPYQAIIKNHIVLQDKKLAEKAERYFGSPNWFTSTEKINLFSQLTGRLTLPAGRYQSEGESLATEPMQLEYNMDLKQGGGAFEFSWAGFYGATALQSIMMESLIFASNFSDYATPSDHTYLLEIANIVFTQHHEESLLRGVKFSGSRYQEQGKETISMTNDLVVNSYQADTKVHEVFNDNHIKLALTGLYQPAFDFLYQGASTAQEVEIALTQLVNYGAKITLSQLHSQTPWGKVDGDFDLTLDKGASLTDIRSNPYTLFDYISGDANLALPLGLLEDPEIAESLQLGVMSGLLVMDEQALNLQTSFQLGELLVNGRVIPL